MNKVKFGERKMKEKALFLTFAFIFAASILTGANNSGLILPMPGQIFEQPQNKSNQQIKKQIPQAQQQTSQQVNQNQTSPSYVTSQESSQRAKQKSKPTKPIDPNTVFIPLPASGQRTKSQEPKKQKAAKQTAPKMQNDPQSLIQLPAQTEPEENSEIDGVSGQNSEIPSANYANVENEDSMQNSDQYANSGSETVEPPIITTETPQVVNAEGAGSVTVFPKDTSSAIFMVMKSWQCEDYDASTLLSHAVGVYAQEAEDQFQIEGLPEEADSYTVSIEEEDITLDELLDIIAQKAGRDWGVDMSTKTIHFYPASVTAAAKDTW